MDNSVTVFPEVWWDTGNSVFRLERGSVVIVHGGREFKSSIFDARGQGKLWMYESIGGACGIPGAPGYIGMKFRRWTCFWGGTVRQCHRSKPKQRAFSHNPFMIKWKGNILMDILASERPSGILRTASGCVCDVHLCVYVMVVIWVKGYVDKGKVCKAIEFFTYILYSSPFSFQTRRRSSCFGTGIPLPQRDCDSLKLRVRYFSWPFLSHALLWLVAFNRLWPLFMSKGITGWAVSPFLFPSELACLPHVWFRK